MKLTIALLKQLEWQIELTKGFLVIYKHLQMLEIITLLTFRLIATNFFIFVVKTLKICEWKRTQHFFSVGV